MGLTARQVEQAPHQRRLLLVANLTASAFYSASRKLIESRLCKTMWRCGKVTTRNWGYELAFLQAVGSRAFRLSSRRSALLLRNLDRKYV